MATLAIQVTDRDGVAVTRAACSGGGDKFANTGKEWVEFVNSGVATRTITFVTTKTVAGAAVADRVETVAAGVTKRFGPFKPRTYNNQTDGLLSMTYDAVTSLTVNVGRLGTL